MINRTSILALGTAALLGGTALALPTSASAAFFARGGAGFANHNFAARSAPVMSPHVVTPNVVKSVSTPSFHSFGNRTFAHPNTVSNPNFATTNTAHTLSANHLLTDKHVPLVEQQYPLERSPYQ